LILKWLKKNAYNNSAHYFKRGFKDNVIAADVQSWGISALGVQVLNTFEKNAAELIVEFLEKNCVSKVKYKKPDGNEAEISGVDFTDKNRLKKLKRKPSVSAEWTFQLVNAYLRLSEDFEALGDKDKALKYQQKREYFIKNMLKMAIEKDEQFAYPYATSPNAVIGHECKTPRKGNLSAIGAAYAILGLTGFDPLVYNYSKDNTDLIQ